MGTWYTVEISHFRRWFQSSWEHEHDAEYRVGCARMAWLLCASALIPGLGWKERMMGAPAFTAFSHDSYVITLAQTHIRNLTAKCSSTQSFRKWLMHLEPEQ